MTTLNAGYLTALRFQGMKVAKAAVADINRRADQITSETAPSNSAAAAGAKEASSGHTFEASAIAASIALLGSDPSKADTRELLASRLDAAVAHWAAVRSLADLMSAQNANILKLLGRGSSSPLLGLGCPEIALDQPENGDALSGLGSFDTVVAASDDYVQAADTTDADTETAPAPETGPVSEPEPDPAPVIPHFMAYILGSEATSGDSFSTAVDKTVTFTSGPISLEYVDDDATLNGDDAVNEVPDDTTQYVMVSGTSHQMFIDYLMDDGNGRVFAVLDYDIDGDGTFDDAGSGYQDGKILVQLSGSAPLAGQTITFSPTISNGVDVAYADLPQ